MIQASLCTQIVMRKSAYLTSYGLLFLGSGSNGWFAMHSLNLPRHEPKRFGEIDFIVCGPDGVFVLEVKGWRFMP